MLPLTRKYKFKVPNQLAVFAALLLVVTSFAGLGSSSLHSDRDYVARATPDVSVQAPSKVQATVSSSAKKNNGFKMSLFLFRNH